MINYLEKLLDGQKVEWRKLGEVAELSNTGVDKKCKANEKKVRLLNFVDVFQNQYINNHTPTMIVTAPDKKISNCNILKGDVFITPSSEIIDEIGQSAMAVEDFDNAVYSYHIMRLRIFNKELLQPRFLNYLFQSNFLRRQIKLNAQGITRFGLTQPKWKSLQIPIPPLSVQKEIVKILDKMTELEAALEAELTLRNKQYHYYRDLLLDYNNPQNPFSGSLKKVEWKMLGEIAKKVSSGGTPLSTREDYYGGDIPWLRTQEVKFKEIFDTEIKITQQGLENSSAKWIPENCVIIAISGATAGRSAINKIPLTTNQHCCNIEVDEKIAYYRYVFHWVSSQYEKIKSLGQGARCDLNASIIKNYPIPIPDLETQVKIVAILDKFDTLTQSISEGLPKEIELRQKQYEYYREQLLSF